MNFFANHTILAANLVRVAELVNVLQTGLLSDLLFG